jgi:hypothetical protein
MRRNTFTSASVVRMVFGVGTALGLAAGAHAQWTVIKLHPAGAADSDARGVFGGEQVGVRNLYDGGLLWNGSAASARPLNAAVGPTKFANAVYNGRQGGTVVVGPLGTARDHAALWGPGGNFVDLHPGAEVAIHSSLAAMDGTTQGGSFFDPSSAGATFALSRPCLWHGTPESFVDLTPLGYLTGEVRGVGGGQQVGATFDSFLGAAALWSGTPESFVNLQPEEAFASAAGCTDGVNQYGAILVVVPDVALVPVRWSGTAESWVSMGVPAGLSGEVHATHGGYQVGRTTAPDGSSDSRACIWTAGPGSYADLHAFVPAEYSQSDALGIWRHMDSGTTYVVGYGVNATTTRNEALMWVNGPGVNLITSPAAPADDSASVGGSVPFTVRVLNAGASAAGQVTLTVDLPPASIATFASAVPAPTTVSATQAVFNLGALGAGGAFADVSITLTAVSSNTATIVATSTATGEADPANNTASASTHILAPACVADFNNSGGVTVQDIFDFLAAYFGNDPTADVNASGGVTVQDIFDFLAAYFAGCP